MQAAADDADALDSILFIRPTLEHASVSAWRPFPVARVPEPLPEATPIVQALGMQVTIDGDSASGRVHIYTSEYDVEVLGQPGGALVVPGVEAGSDLDRWLRQVHARYWEYAPELEDVVHSEYADLVTGAGPLARYEEPHLYAPEFNIPKVGWIREGELHCQEIPDAASENARAFAVLEVDSAGTHSDAATMVITHTGYISAALRDGLAPGEEQEAMDAVLSLGVQRFASDIMHQHLHGIVNLAILGDDISRFGSR